MIQAQVYVVKDKEISEGGTGLFVGIDSQGSLAADGRNLSEVQKRYLMLLNCYCRRGYADEYLKDFPELSLSELEKAASRDDKPIKLREERGLIVSQEKRDYLNDLKEILKSRNTDLRIRCYVEVRV